jgi:predicted small lipoprotein YifL
MRIACIMFLFALMLQGCGKKGPLYLPRPQPEQASTQNAEQPSQSQSTLSK